MAKYKIKVRNFWFIPKSAFDIFFADGTSEASFVKHSYLMSKISVFAYFQNYFFILKEHLAQRNTLVPLAPTQTAHRFIVWINVPIVRKGCIV